MPQDGSTTLPPVLVTGQRRKYGTQNNFSVWKIGTGGSGETMEEAPDPQEPDPSADPCADPDEAAGWTMDAVAVRIFNALREWANSRHPDGINEREYGAAIWRLPNGQFVAGPGA